MKSEPVRPSKLIRPLKAAIPTSADRHEASAARSSSPASIAAEGWLACAAGLTVERSDEVRRMFVPGAARSAAADRPYRKHAKVPAESRHLPGCYLSRTGRKYAPAG